MAFTVETHQKSGISIVQLHGRLVLGDATRQVREIVKGLVAQGQLKLVLDVGDVDYVDSAGLGTMVACFSSVQNAGGCLKLLHVAKRVGDQLAITKLVTVFENFDDEDQAVASFGATALA